MLTQSIKPRVFVSSVIEGFGAFREAARGGIKAAGGHPVLVNEDFPSVAKSSRNACLDAVDSSDIYIAIIGERGGWEAPSGKLVVEEEYEHARTTGKETLVFLQDVDRDERAVQLAQKMSDYVNGRFRDTFKTPDELESKVQEALSPIINAFNKPATKMDVVQREIEEPNRFNQDASLRFVLAPSVQEEVVNPVKLGSEDFKDQIYGIGLDRKTHLFSHQQAKRDEIEGDALIIRQESSGRGMNAFDSRISINEVGHVVIDINLSARQGTRGSVNMNHMTVSIPRVRTHVEGSFAFAEEVYDRIDKFQRYVRFDYNVALLLGNCVLVEEEVPNRSSLSMGWSTPGEENILAFEKPRTMSRSGLHNAAEEIDRILARFVQRVTPQ